MGTGLVYSALPTLVLQAVPQEQTASATGLNVLMRTMGQSVCSTTVVAVLAQFTTDVHGTAYPTLNAYLIVFALAAAACTAAALPGKPSAKSAARPTSRTARPTGPATGTAHTRAGAPSSTWRPSPACRPRGRPTPHPLGRPPLIPPRPAAGLGPLSDLRPSGTRPELGAPG